VSAITPLALIDPRTVEAIQGTRPNRLGTSNDPYPCGCHLRNGGSWYLCDYHEGYEDALAVHQQGATQ
jgi:hypothetical protein